MDDGIFISGGNKEQVGDDAPLRLVSIAEWLNDEGGTSSRPGVDVPCSASQPDSFILSI